MENPTKETKEQWRNDPANWKLFLFYYNKKDKRLLPPKRFQYFGWTINFANPWSIVVTIVIIAIISVIGYAVRGFK